MLLLFWESNEDLSLGYKDKSSKNKHPGFDPSFELQTLLKKTIKSHHNHNIVAYDLLLQRQKFQLNSKILQSQSIKELLYIEVLQISKFENTHILKLVETMNLPEIFKSEIKFRDTLQNAVGLFSRTLAVDNTDVNRAICSSPKLLFFDSQSLRARMDSLKNKNYFPFFHRDLKELFLLSPGVWYCEDIADIVAKIDYILKNMNIDPAKGVIKTYDANSRQNEIKKLVKSKKKYVELSLFDIKARHQFLLRRGQWTAQDNRGRVIGGDNPNPMLDDILGAKNKYVFCLKTAKCQLEKERFEKSLEVEIFEKEDKNPGDWCIREFEQFELMFERELELSEKSLDEKLGFEERVLTMKNYRAGDNALRRDRSSLNSDYVYNEKYSALKKLIWRQNLAIIKVFGVKF